MLFLNPIALGSRTQPHHPRDQHLLTSVTKEAKSCKREEYTLGGTVLARLPPNMIHTHTRPKIINKNAEDSKETYWNLRPQSLRRACLSTIKWPFRGSSWSITSANKEGSTSSLELAEGAGRRILLQPRVRHQQLHALKLTVRP